MLAFTIKISTLSFLKFPSTFHPSSGNRLNISTEQGNHISFTAALNCCLRRELAFIMFL